MADLTILEILLIEHDWKWKVMNEFLKENSFNLKLIDIMDNSKILKLLLKQTNDEEVIKAINEQLNKIENW
jgi:hypothetical protein